MEALIPKLFILTAEASVILLLLLIAIIIFNSKAKRNDLKAVNKLISNYNSNKEERITTLKNHLQNIGFKGNSDEQAEKLYQNEKSSIKEFVTLYLRRDTYRLLDYPDNLIEADDLFLKTSGAGLAATLTAAPDISETADDSNTVNDSNTVDDSNTSNNEQAANATIIAREQAESNDAHLKELAELRLKNTELNEQLFESLETITELMTEHGKKTGQEVASNAQKILEAIIYLRDKRLNNSDPTTLAPSADDNHDQVSSFDVEDDYDSNEAGDPFSAALADNDATLDDHTAVSLGIHDKLNIDLDTLEDDTSDHTQEKTTVINIDDTSVTSTAEADLQADSLADQADAEASIQTDTNAEVQQQPEAITEEEDPWADALAEQADAEASAQTDTHDEVQQQPEAIAEEEDPWADALAEQAGAEAESEASAEEVDPWAEALAEQAKSEKK